MNAHRNTDQVLNDLRTSRERYRILVEILPHGIQEADTRGVITFANPAHHRIHGYPDGELVGKSILDLTHPDARDDLRDLLERLVEEQPTPTPRVGRDIRTDGHAIDVRVDWDYRRDEQGRVVGFISVISDITAQQEAERAGAESESRFRSIFDNSAVGTVLLSLDGEVVDANDAICQLLGFPHEELVGQRFSGFAYPKDAPLDNTLFSELLAGSRTSYTIDKRHAHKDGRLVWGRLSVSKVQDAHGEPRYAIVVCEDITERKRAEEQLNEEHEHMSSLMEIGGDVVLYRLAARRDAPFAGEVALVSPSVREVLGIDDPSDFATWFENIHVDDLARVTLANRHSLESGVPFDEVMRIRHPDEDQPRWIRAVSRPVMGDDGQTLFCNGIIIDITDLKRAADAQTRLTDGIGQDFNRLLDDILANADLALAGMAEAASGRDSVEKIEAAARRAVEITGQLLAAATRSQRPPPD